MRSISGWIFQCAVAVAASGLVGLAAAQGYPAKRIRCIIQSPDYKQRQLEVATDIVGSSAEALARFQKTEIEKYRKIAEAAGIKPE